MIDLTFIREQLDKAFARIKILDNSIDVEKIKKDLLSYYTEKFSKLEESFEFDFIDLFSGAGGLSVGLEQEGFRPIIAVDKDKSALTTYRFNRPWMSEENVIHEDIRDLVDCYQFPHVPVIVGGPPCQGFSVVNQHKKENDERNELYKFYVHAVSQAQPELFLMENVEGILQLYEHIKEDFEKVGFIVCRPLILSPKDFGFPQSRRRAFILGINMKHENITESLFEVFKATIEEAATGIKYTLWDAICDLPALKAKTLKNATYSESAEWGYSFAGMTSSSTEYTQLINQGLPGEVPLLNHRSKYNNERDIQIYSLLKPGEKSDAKSIQEINPYKNRADMFKDKFDKLVANEPCKTITAHMYYDCNMYIHPYQARGLTPREAARVQGFPDDYLFLGSPNEWYRQIGNAVSPLMARVLARGLKKVLKEIEENEANN
ncbi:DNA cytosine methyltransferase [Fournierella massiliensis]|uniref:DNA (cytosine-5-)-methyltransferase n=1 Tax=Allofournierella massiliensis TaxID=1650663 RepID=A0ABT7UU07_9FIRM|nr:DNA cytosine methyltransferase [Fournierella massiliensis]MDM8202386.1 DNA cytosine methyltransferase [Fournierella massiliensis]